MGLEAQPLRPEACPAVGLGWQVWLESPACVTFALMGLKDLFGKKSSGAIQDQTIEARDPLEDPLVLAFIFHPRQDSPSPVLNPGVRDLTFQLSPEVQIGARFYGAEKSSPNLIFFHGNGEIASDYDDVAQLYAERGLNLLVLDYRGYGRSTGTPTLKNMLQDAMELMDPVSQWLAQEGYESARWVMGRSLGSCPAIHVARHRADLLRGLVVESGFSDTLGLLQRIGLPIRGLEIPPEWRNFNLEGIAHVELPTLVIHGEWDQIIPLGDGVALYEASKASRKELVVIPRAGHNDLLWVGMEQYMGALANFIKKG